MEYIYLLGVVVLISLQNFISKQYNLKADAFNIWLFSAMTTFGAFLFFFANAGFQIRFVSEVLPYSIGFALFFGAATVGSVMAIRSGLFSLSTLVNSYSLLIPTLYGILFLGDRIGVFGYTGIVLLLFSIYLLNKKKEDVRFTLRWLVWILVTFFGDGLCSSLQKMQQLHFDGMYKNELMLYALAILTLAFLTAGIVTGKNIKKELPESAAYGLAKGVANGIVNYLVMVLTGVLPNAILFPMISAGGIVIAFILSQALYHERLSKMQIVGYIMGTVSVILLNV